MKKGEEIEKIKAASELARQSIVDGLSRVRSGRHEGEIQGAVEMSIRSRGGKLAKATQVTSGLPGQQVLDAQNDQTMKDGLVVVDLGVRLDGYCSHICRTIPVAETWSPAWAKAYEILVDNHTATLKGLMLGADPTAVLERYRSALRQFLDPVVLVSGEARSGYRDTYLGGEINSIGLELREGEIDGTLKAGMVLEVTTAIAISNSSRFKKDYRGVQIRLTDVIAVGETGCEWLTKGAPLEVDQLSSIRAGR